MVNGQWSMVSGSRKCRSLLHQRCLCLMLKVAFYYRNKNPICQDKMAKTEESKMDSFLTLEWDERCGIKSAQAVILLDGIEDFLKDKNYGTSIRHLTLIIICRAHDFKQRKRYRKALSSIYFDVLLDYYLMKNVEPDERKKLMQYQIVKITEETIGKYKFDDFDKQRFLSDFRVAVETTKW